MNRWVILFYSIVFFASTLTFAQESNLKNIRKLTFGGDNAEAYFSPDGKTLTLQVTNHKNGIECDQIFTLDVDKKDISSKDLKLISTGQGRTTCSFFMPDGKHILYASTHAKNKSCPEVPKPRSDGKYIWSIYPDFDIFIADLNGNIVKQLTNSPGYDAEAVVSPDGKKIAFTSIRSGDLEIWTMDIDGSHLKQITSGLGYDGGCFFSHDSKKLVFRASRPILTKDIEDYKSLLNDNLVTPTQMEIYTCNVDGSNLKQITTLGKANWAPYFLPNDDRIIFSSNHHSKKGYDFQLYTIDTTGNNLHQVTYLSEFNAFPMFSPDGKRLVFSSNRLQDAPRETNVFIADWVENDEHEMVDNANLKAHIKFLSSDELKGRLTGSKGEKKAAKYLSKYFKSLGLQGLEGKSFLQPFEYDYQPNPHGSDAVKKMKIKGTNVIAYLNNDANRTLIIGAHYDHIGLNEHHNSTNPNSTGEIHNGADDNASGVAGVLELARMYTTNKTKEPMNIIFACFSGEEDGLMGSKHLAEYLDKHQFNITFMANMDMIGRLDSLTNLMVGGVGTSPSFGNIVEKNKPAGFLITLDSSGVGPTDHTSFYLKNIPVLNFFTGTHTDYHKPSDDENKINYTGVEKIITYIFKITNEIGQSDKVEFTKTNATPSKSAPKYKVTMGIMPDYKDYGDGLHIDAVIENRPAQMAGLEAGDIITFIGTCPVKEVYGYMDCLSKIKSGDELEVTYMRNKEVKKTKIKF